MRVPRELPSVRVLPMSDKAKAFVGRRIADVQRALFVGDLPAGWAVSRSADSAEFYISSPGSFRTFEPVDADGMRKA
jgi:hypothetical protein